jgi:anti-sigma B factor antagonist
MQIATETFGNVLVAHTPDELTADSLSVFLDALQSHMESGQHNIVLQMDRCDTYDSEGLTAIVDLKDELRMSGGNLKVSGLNEHSAKIFEVTRLDKSFELFDSVIDAVSSFK